MRRESRGGFSHEKVSDCLCEPFPSSSRALESSELARETTLMTRDLGLQAAVRWLWIPALKFPYQAKAWRKLYRLV